MLWRVLLLICFASPSSADDAQQNLLLEELLRRHTSANFPALLSIPSNPVIPFVGPVPSECTHVLSGRPGQQAPNLAHDDVVCENAFSPQFGSSPTAGLYVGEALITRTISEFVSGTLTIPLLGNGANEHKVSKVVLSDLLDIQFNSQSQSISLVLGGSFFHQLPQAPSPAEIERIRIDVRPLIFSGSFGIDSATAFQPRHMAILLDVVVSDLRLEGLSPLIAKQVANLLTEVIRSSPPVDEGAPLMQLNLLPTYYSAANSVGKGSDFVQQFTEGFEEWELPIQAGISTKGNSVLSRFPDGMFHVVIAKNGLHLIFNRGFSGLGDAPVAGVKPNIIADSYGWFQTEDW